MSPNFTKLIYIFDPLCGWCYAFEPVMEKIQEEFKDKIEFEVISGGMILKPNARPIGEMRDYLKEAIPRLTETTGVNISKEYLENILEPGDIALNSEVPSLVYSAFLPKHKGKEVKWANKVQKILFEEGRNSNDINSYQEILNSVCDKDPEEVKGCVLSEENRSNTFKMFQRTAELGVRGFPFLGLEDETGKIYQVSSGYVPYEKLKKFIISIT